MPNPWLNEHKSTAAMNFFLNKDALKKLFKLNLIMFERDFKFALKSS